MLICIYIIYNYFTICVFITFIIISLPAVFVVFAQEQQQQDEEVFEIPTKTICVAGNAAFSFGFTSKRNRRRLRGNNKNNNNNKWNTDQTLFSLINRTFATETFRQCTCQHHDWDCGRDVFELTSLDPGTHISYNARQ